MTSPFFGVFGSPLAVLRYGVCSARILQFPVRRNAIAELRAEVEEIKTLLVVRALKVVGV